VDSSKSDHVGIAGEMPGTKGGFTMAVFSAESVPPGTKLYTKEPVILSEKEHEMLRDVLRSFQCNAGNGAWYIARIDFMQHLISRTLP
jgi:hypothetical protein